jgi:hypothetical protein
MAALGWENATIVTWAAVSGRFGAAEQERFAGLPVVVLEGGPLVVRATTGEAKRRALRRLDTLAPEHALQVPTSLFEQTFGMRFDVDLIWLDVNNDVVRVDRDVAPRRLRWCTPARSVVETAAGHAGDFLVAGLGTRSQMRGQPVVSEQWQRASGLSWVFRAWRR